MRRAPSEEKLSAGERLSWLLIAGLCLFFGYRLGAQSASGERLALKRALEQAERPTPLAPVIPRSPDQGLDERAQGGSSSEQTPQPFLSEGARARVCPPCDCPCEPPKPRRKVRAKKKRLPPPKMSPLERSKLLAWVRKHSERLRRCRDTGQPIYRLHTKLKLKADASGVASVQLTGDDVPPAALSCIQREILRWPPPDGLTPSKHPTLVFTLQLD